MFSKKIEKSLSVNAILNILKQGCSILIPLVSYPYITRVLGSDGLGKYSFADSIVQYFAIFALLGIPTYAVREGARVREKTEKIRALAAELFTLSLLSGLISVGIYLLLVCTIPQLRAEKSLFLLLGTRIMTSVLGRDWINTIYEDFFYITVRYILFELVALSLIFLTVKEPDDYIKYAAIMLLGFCGPDIFNIFYTQRYVPMRAAPLSSVKKHVRPVLYLFSTTIAVNIYIHSDVTILGFMKTSGEVGVYALASKVYLAVKAVLNALIAVMIPRVSYYLGEDKQIEYETLLRKLRWVLYAIVLPAIALTFVLSHFIMSFLGGEEYLRGATTLRILCIALFFAVFGSYYAQAVLIPNREEKYFFHTTVASAIINIVLNLVMIPYLGMNGAAITTVLAEGFVMFRCRHKARQLQKLEANETKNIKGKE